MLPKRRMQSASALFSIIVILAWTTVARGQTHQKGKQNSNMSSDKYRINDVEMTRFDREFDGRTMLHERDLHTATSHVGRVSIDLMFIHVVGDRQRFMLMLG